MDIQDPILKNYILNLQSVRKKQIAKPKYDPFSDMYSKAESAPANYDFVESSPIKSQEYKNVESKPLGESDYDQLIKTQMGEKAPEAAGLQDIYKYAKEGKGVGGKVLGGIAGLLSAAGSSQGLKLLAGTQSNPYAAKSMVESGNEVAKQDEARLAAFKQARDVNADRLKGVVENKQKLAQAQSAQNIDVQKFLTDKSLEQQKMKQSASESQRDYDLRVKQAQVDASLKAAGIDIDKQRSELEAAKAKGDTGQQQLDRFKDLLQTQVAKGTLSLEDARTSLENFQNPAHGELKKGFFGKYSMKPNATKVETTSMTAF